MHQQQSNRTCADCGDTYVYTEAEQRFRTQQGMSEPTKCPECRAERRAQRNADILGTTGGGSTAARERNARRRSRGASNGSQNDRYPAICADCGQSTMVPFVPRGDRPVYCRSCFNARRGR
ncbi:MAG TPA: CxxC-x17-CxxC domain-containing protein [Thermomicrobiales bacterium]|nr:CxxC-x17-CxxC domain-containing protein [Thermomicrobiales bacterium]